LRVSAEDVTFEAHAGVEVEHHPRPLEYIIIGLILAVITVLEVYAYVRIEVRSILVPTLLTLSAIKFFLVVSFYMHLRFDHPIFRAVFCGGLAVAGSIITALIFLFGQYPYPPHP
jgi:cytochrome c oxidase subunit 4